MIKILLSTRLGERRWTQAKLSRLTGIRAATINEYYHELVERIDLAHLDLICKALECQPADLIIYDDSAPFKERHRKGKNSRKRVKKSE